MKVRKSPSFIFVEYPWNYFILRVLKSSLSSLSYGSEGWELCSLPSILSLSLTSETFWPLSRASFIIGNSFFLASLIFLRNCSRILNFVPESSRGCLRTLSLRLKELTFTTIDRGFFFPHQIFQLYGPFQFFFLINDQGKTWLGFAKIVNQRNTVFFSLAFVFSQPKEQKVFLHASRL